jgi:exosortase
MFARLRSGLPAVHVSPLAVLGGVAVAAAVGWVFWPTFVELAGRWGSESQYSHGYLVPVFAAYLLWARRNRLAGATCRPSPWGLVVLLAVGLGIRFAGTYIFLDWLVAAAIVPCVAGLMLLVGGWPALRWGWPAAVFLIFMVPLPFRLERELADPLQTIATRASTYCLQTLGFVAFSEGHVIRMGQVRIGVVEACSGLSMLVIFFALSTAVVMLVNRPWFEKLVIFLSAIPIALAANITRITVTGMLHKLVGSEWADYVFHDLAGWLMMPLALCMLAVELRLLSWVLVSRGHRRRSHTLAFEHAAREATKQPAAAAAPAAKPVKVAVKDGQRVVLPGLGLVVTARKEPPSGSSKGVS